MYEKKTVYTPAVYRVNNYEYRCRCSLPSREGQSLHIYSDPQDVVLATMVRTGIRTTTCPDIWTLIHEAGYQFPRTPLLGFSVNRGNPGLLALYRRKTLP